MRIRTGWTASTTRVGNVRITTRTKVPMLPTLRTSTTFATAPPRRKRRKKR